ncbi:hypothetical protein DLREEDagrD3_27310 [Denitratisoma sp. agr-D3]
MLTMPTQIEIYEDMSQLSARMVEAARIQDWTLLASLEESVAKLRKTLEADDDIGVLSADESERKRTLIQQILEDDAEVRRHTEPWMEHVRQFLGSSNQRRRVERAYGAGA